MRYRCIDDTTPRASDAMKKNTPHAKGLSTKGPAIARHAIRGIGIHIADGGEIELEDSASVTVADGAAARILIRPKKDMSVKIHSGTKCDIRTLIVGSVPVDFKLVNHIDSGSLIETDSFWGEGGVVSIESILEGRGAEVHEKNFFVVKGASDLHLHSILVHRARETKGDILAKGVVKDCARAALGGMIRVEKTGAGAESFLSEHVIVLDKGAHASANPELEILNNDVASRHSASVSRIDEKKIFYLMSRGLDREDARKLIVDGFFGSAIERIEDEKIRGEMASLVGSST